MLKVSELEEKDRLHATEQATASVEETGVEVQVQVPEGAMPGQQVPCQTAAEMPAHMITIPLNAQVALPSCAGRKAGRLAICTSIFDPSKLRAIACIYTVASYAPCTYTGGRYDHSEAA